jgi:hypothetical protein
MIFIEQKKLGYLSAAHSSQEETAPVLKELFDQLTIVNNFIENPKELFDSLKQSITWDTSMRARHTASCGVPYNYSNIDYEHTDFLPQLKPLVEGISQRLGFTPNNCLMNLYHDGNSSMGYHADNPESIAEGTGVAIVSLGSERALTFKNIKDRNLESSILLPSGSLFYMTRAVQFSWLHGMMKVDGIQEPRMSLTFRCVPNLDIEYSPTRGKS